MKEYRFEYTKTGLLIAIATGSLILAIVIALLLPDLGLLFGINLNAVIGLATGILIIFLARNNYKKIAEALLSDEEAIFKFDGSESKVEFQNLEYYKIEYGNGVSLTLKMQDQPLINFVANSNFCNAQLLDGFCTKLEEKMLAYKVQTSAALVRRPSIFEQKWMLYFLLTATGIIIFLTFQSLSQNGKIAHSITSTYYIFSVLWLAWIVARIRKR
ncbi:hypothetical protein [Dyadobacter sp. CY323]|uniref:hypothetical protein n=1 Tax=Dyadobacter sp. CY323 TaxID=2907302 RepID=UPI001F3593E9|nr:hypothetical protein [Dyadobacter sp. CY323]MCE6991451.1 hypothetical protein [Dyadobacter sp. CY323]